MKFVFVLVFVIGFSTAGAAEPLRFLGSTLGAQGGGDHHFKWSNGGTMCTYSKEVGDDAKLKNTCHYVSQKFQGTTCPTKLYRFTSPTEYDVCSRMKVPNKCRYMTVYCVMQESVNCIVQSNSLRKTTLAESGGVPGNQMMVYDCKKNGSYSPVDGGKRGLRNKAYHPKKK